MCKLDRLCGIAADIREGLAKFPGQLIQPVRHFILRWSRLKPLIRHLRCGEIKSVRGKERHQLDEFDIAVVAKPGRLPNGFYQKRLELPMPFKRAFHAAKIRLGEFENILAILGSAAASRCVESVYRFALVC